MALQMVRSRFVTRFLNHGKHRTHRKEAEPFLRPKFRVFRVFRGSRMLFVTRFSTTENTEHTERKLSLSYVLNSVYSVCSVVQECCS